MAKIRLSEGGFQLIPEGVEIFKITEVEYKEDYGKLNVTMQTKSGAKHIERFTFSNKSGEVVQGAINAFSYFAKTALNNFNLEEIEHDDLVGCYIKAEVTHEEFESNREPGKMLKSVRLKNWEVASGFGKEKAKEKAEEEIDDLDDLDDFLDE